MLLLNPRAVARCRPVLQLAPRTFHLRFAYRFKTSTLAYMLDSLVRVSRRDGKVHFHKIVRRPLKPSALSLDEGAASRRNVCYWEHVI